MQAITNPFAHIINGPKQFVIPVFQRDYSWGPEQCNRMWSDVLKSADDDGQHFLGSFVYVDEQVGAAFGSWLVFGNAVVVEPLLIFENFSLGWFENGVEPAEHGHRQDHVTVLAADVEVA